MHSVQNVLFVFVIFARSYYTWRVVPAHKASYALRARDEGIDHTVHSDYDDYEEKLPRNSLHTLYKFGWCTHDAIQSVNLYKSANYSMPTLHDADTQWIYVLDAENNRKFSLQCVVVKVYVAAKYALKRTRIPFNYCQGSVFYLMMNTVGRMLIHEFYFMTQFTMPATFVFEYYQPIIL